MKKLTYIFILAALLTACKKKSAVTIQAQNLTNFSDGSHYAGAHYMVIERRSGLSLDNIKSKVLVDDYLDANGHTSFDIKMNNNRSYVLGIEKPDNICYTEVTIEHFLDHDKNNVVNFKYAPCAYLKFILNNANCIGTDDSITYSRIWVSNNEFEGSNTYVGCDYFEGDYFELSSGEYRYDWEVFKNGVSNSFSQNFVLNEGDSVIFQIDY